MKNLYIFVLAGGSGERLWPLSKKNCPKQLIPFLGNSSLLQQTIERVTMPGIAKDRLWVITHKDQAEKVRELVGENVGRVVAEPCARNTGPAILFACHEIYKDDPDAIIAVLPSDHFIPNKKDFREVLEKAYQEVETQEKIACLGLMPTFPATGYGYIHANLEPERKEQKSFYQVISFHEKPDFERAQKYIQQQEMLWNIGIFIGRVKVFIQEFENCAPDLAEKMRWYMSGKISYEDLPKISIDYAVMEKSRNIIVFPADFEWYDVGNLNTFLSLKAQYSHDNLSVISIEGKGNLASTHKKVVACVGVSDLCIVETDDVLLVAEKSKIEEVKQVLAQVKKIHEHMA